MLRIFGGFQLRIGPELFQNFPNQILITLEDQDMFGKLPQLKLGVNHQDRKSKLGKDSHSLFHSTFPLGGFPNPKKNWGFTRKNHL